MRGMGIFKRKDSPFWQLLLEQGHDQRPKRLPTKIPVNGGSPQQTKENQRCAQQLYSQYMLAQHNAGTVPFHMLPVVARRKPACHLYFIRCGDQIKIGRSVNVQKRLQALITSAGRPMQLLATISNGGDREPDFHRQFRDSRLRGEWFRVTPALLDEIAAINSRSNHDASGEFGATSTGATVN